jgi:hypothetical protein
VSPVRYELGFYIPEDTILHSHRRENLKSYKMLMGGDLLGCAIFCFLECENNFGPTLAAMYMISRGLITEDILVVYCLSCLHRSTCTVGCSGL